MTAVVHGAMVPDSNDAAIGFGVLRSFLPIGAGLISNNLIGDPPALFSFIQNIFAEILNVAAAIIDTGNHDTMGLLIRTL